ncbi:MAG: hypothetical protein KC486_31990, partial [Myxococcales bacterium]|nr:hypothetical protein [Myxococcales bacterium]
EFGNPQLGNQYECGDGCIKVPFPTYKGCDNILIGALSSLRLIVSLDPAASSVLETVSVTVYHRKLKKKACCESCAKGGSCSCG